MFPFMRNRLVRTGSRSFVSIVHKGYEAWRLSLGTNAERLEPGVYLRIPLFHKLHKVNMMEQSYLFDKILATTKDNVKVKLSVNCFYKIVDSEKVIFKIDNFNNSFDIFVTSTIRNVIAEINHDEFIKRQEDNNYDLMVKFANSSEKWGVVLNKLEIEDITFFITNDAKTLKKLMICESSQEEYDSVSDFIDHVFVSCTLLSIMLIFGVVRF